MPGLDRLGELLDQLRSAGLAVELAVDGRAAGPRPRARGLGLPDRPGGAHELAQARRRRPGPGRVRYTPARWRSTIEDERGQGTPSDVEPPHEGRGLIGMRERAAMLRGTLVAHPTADGFVVTARLPINGAAAAA